MQKFGLKGVLLLYSLGLLSGLLNAAKAKRSAMFRCFLWKSGSKKWKMDVFFCFCWFCLMMFFSKTQPLIFLEVVSPPWKRTWHWKKPPFLSFLNKEIHRPIYYGCFFLSVMFSFRGLRQSLAKLSGPAQLCVGPPPADWKVPWHVMTWGTGPTSVFLGPQADRV